MSSGDGGVYSGAHHLLVANNLPCQRVLRALEGIKDKLELLSKRSAGHTEKEGDTTAADDLADDLRDAIVEYQVGTNIEESVRSRSFIM